MVIFAKYKTKRVPAAILKTGALRFRYFMSTRTRRLRHPGHGREELVLPPEAAAAHGQVRDAAAHLDTSVFLLSVLLDL